MSDVRLPNNIVKNCPGVMAYGAYWTDWRPRCHQAASAQQPRNSFQYRMFLTQNAEKIMGSVRDDVIRHNTCAGCPAAQAAGTMLPEQVLTVCNKQTCQAQPGVACGLGGGRQGAFADGYTVGGDSLDAYSPYAAAIR